MTSVFKPEGVLIREGTKLPGLMQIETVPGVPGWRLVRDFRGDELDRKLRTAGWSFFFLATKVEATVLGSGAERRALRRVVHKVAARNLNALEIIHTVSKRFLGIPYTSVLAHSRHIQESTILT